MSPRFSSPFSSNFSRIRRYWGSRVFRFMGSSARDKCAQSFDDGGLLRVVHRFQRRAHGRMAVRVSDSNRIGAQRTAPAFGDTRDYFGSHAERPPRRIEHRQTAGFLHGTQHRFQVQRRNGPQIDHLGLDAVFGELRGDPESERNHDAGSDQGEVRAGPAHRSLPEANPVGEFRYAVFQTEQRPVLDHDHRVLAEYALEQEAFGVKGGRGHGDFESRNMGKPRMQALRMLRTLSPAAPDDRPDRHRRRRCSVGFETPERKPVDDSIYRIEHEIEAMVHQHRPHARDGGANAERGHGALRHRKVANAFGAESLYEARRLAEHPRRLIPHLTPYS